jgi:hypothetical protein
VRSYLPPGREVLPFTFLREPVDRTISHYFQIRESSRSELAAGAETDRVSSTGLEPLAEGATIDDAAASGHLIDNLQTRMLSDDPEPFGEVTEPMLEQAKRNIEDPCFMFGLADRFDESLVLARRRLGLSVVVAPARGRVSTSRPRGEGVPDDHRAAAERLNVHDVALYRHATQLFDSAPEVNDIEFHAEVAALRTVRDEEEVEPDAPSPFDGGLEEWRMQLAASVSLLRAERELATIRAKTFRLAQRARARVDQVAAEVDAVARAGAIGAQAGGEL